MIAAKVALIEAFEKRKCHQSCQSQTGENNRTEGGPGCILGLHKLGISLPLHYYFLPCTWWGGRGGDEEKTRWGEWGVVETWVKNAKPEHCYLVFIPLEPWQYPQDAQAL